MSAAETAGRKVRFGVFELDPQTGELRKRGLRIPLQEQPFRVLTALVERPGELVTRDALRKKLWPDDTFVDFDQGLGTAIRKIREALGDTADNPRFIETLPHFLRLITRAMGGGEMIKRNRVVGILSNCIV